MIFERRDIGTGDDVYLTRWYLLPPRRAWYLRWGTPALFLHKVWRSDHSRDLHDHPWSFLSLVLREGFLEAVPARGTSHLGLAYRERKPGRLRWYRATELHRICAVARPAHTLVLVGRRRRRWGFQTPDGWREAEHQ